MTEPITSARAATGTTGEDRLALLVDRIAAGDRAAFRCLYAFLAMAVWREAVRALPHAADARAVTRSTFVEVWHLARHHVDGPGTDTSAWIGAIMARRVGERLRAGGPPGTRGGEHDRHVHCGLVALLGAGHATVRIEPTAFGHVDDLALDLATWPEPPGRAAA